jgi:hypothetical protein
MSNLQADFQRFSHLLTLAEERLSHGHADAAAALAQVAARFAFPANVGLFASPRLEALLRSLAGRVRGTPGAARHASGRRHVVHLLSYAKPIGGDSRFVWRWIGRDRTSRHSVIVTSQQEVAHEYQIPQVLLDGVAASGGFVKTLSSPLTRPLQQASELRGLLSEGDIVALHVYPYDIVPNLALTGLLDRVCPIYVNHSDHTFWIGGAVARWVTHLRAQSKHFIEERRGLRADRGSILPIPLDDQLAALPLATERLDAYRKARSELGYGPDTVLLLTIASPFKYNAPGHTGLLDLVLPTLKKHKNAVLVAVGPSGEAEWLQAKRETDGRVVALGRRWDNEALLAAADVYLDSVPFSSITSLLEAGARGLPLLSYVPPNEELSLLGPGAPGIDQSMLVCSAAAQYRDALERLILEPAFRLDAGTRVQASIRSSHLGTGWESAVSEAYERAQATDTQSCLVARQDEFHAGELNDALVRLFDKVQGPTRIRTLMAQYIGALDYRSRIGLTVELAASFGVCVRNLLPRSVDRGLRGVVRQLRRAVA